MEENIVVATFYKFLRLPDYRNLRNPLLARCQSLGVRGTILLAEEGINATIAGERDAVDGLLSYLRGDRRFADLLVKESIHSSIPFQRMKVRLKPEIVAMKVAGVDPNRQVGKYIEPRDWNSLIAQDDVLLVDARNDYEVRIGRFKSAINPKTESFHELPSYFAGQLDPKRNMRVAMYCTGGIRCEKATAYLLQLGFEEVYHLRGGILRYLEEVEPAESLWQGECFVFDERVSLDHSLRKGETVICDDCKAMVKRTDEACLQCGSANIL
ncbi:MAG: rhodanese-related sulfurtransferase [Chloroflexi bacterium]|nr:rhodanese-related sulfurtransferase [Chloroflexota bacterium]